MIDRTCVENERLRQEDQGGDVLSLCDWGSCGDRWIFVDCAGLVGHDMAGYLALPPAVL